MARQTRGVDYGPAHEEAQGIGDHCHRHLPEFKPLRVQCVARSARQRHKNAGTAAVQGLRDRLIGRSRIWRSRVHFELRRGRGQLGSGQLSCLSVDPQPEALREQRLHHRGHLRSQGAGRQGRRDIESRRCQPVWPDDTVGADLVSEGNAISEGGRLEAYATRFDPGTGDEFALGPIQPRADGRHLEPGRLLRQQYGDGQSNEGSRHASRLLQNTLHCKDALLGAFTKALVFAPLRAVYLPSQPDLSVLRALCVLRGLRG